MDLLQPRAKKSHPLQWVTEPIEEEPSFIAKPMFGCIGCYLYGRLVLVLAARPKEPWHGLLIPTDKQQHESLRREHRNLVTHPVLKKWLYLPEQNEEFEESAMALVASALANDPRIGVEPRTKPTQRGVTKWKRRSTT